MGSLVTLVARPGKAPAGESDGTTKQVLPTPAALLASHPTGMLTSVACAAVVWTAIVALPLALTRNDAYVALFPADWYSYTPAASDLHGAANATNGNAAVAAAVAADGASPKPLGLCLGILAVAVGQAFMLSYHWLHRNGYFGLRPAIQLSGPRPYEFAEGLATHLSQPEGFVLLGGYLVGTWLLGLLPASYYAFEGGISWGQVAAQLLIQDFVQYGMHRVEHVASPALYKLSHKPHHRFVNPRLFDAFNGSAADTTLMILVPLYVTAMVVHCNVWSYMAFGSLYANWLSLIHSEYPHPWDGAFRLAGLGTAADHHVHHKLFKYNFGHLFMYWDMLGGTYRNPADCSRVFNKNV